jgi:predicted P-loop ATPase
VCGGLGGEKGESCSINLNTGVWSDFATGDRGGDLISLYSAIKGLGMADAARELMAQLGVVPQPVAQPAEPPAAPKRTTWRPVVPVPPHAPPATFKHFSRELQDVEASWAYRRGGQLLGHVVRFRTSSGGKEILPQTWCVDESDGQGTQRWHWMQWAAPRPLYLPAGDLSEPAREVVLVEGEKCADAGQRLLGDAFDWATWPGGSNAWEKADWEWLRGRSVLLWPDCDAKHQKLSQAERMAQVDPKSKPLLPAAQQPGLKAMNGIAGRLQSVDCQVRMVRIPEPGAVSDGWDVADAIEQGWTREQVLAMLRTAQPFQQAQDGLAEAAEGLPTPSMAGAGQGAAGGAARRKTWRAYLLEGRSGTAPVRENVVAALDGVEVPGEGFVPGVAALQGLLAYNEFTSDVIKLRPAPWGTPEGRWGDVEELQMGEWLVRQQGLPSCPRGTLEEAVRMVAAKHSFHPVRKFVEELEWDGVKRLSTWIRRCCLEEDEWDDREPLQQYLARVGTWFIQGMVSRVMQPGCKFDYMLILEGTQGRGKSTLLKTLACDWFADTGLVLGDKDSYQQLQGRWLYEFAELDSWGKADITKIKSFTASTEDYFRASFDRRAREHPRQVVFGGTTNEDHYLTDPTGNRRFWPVRVTRVIDIEWLRENRNQLFAEAMVRYRSGARMYPTPEEEVELFQPQQRLREVENAIAAAIATYLDSELGELVSEITLVQLLHKIGIGVEKLGAGRWHEKQAAAALRAMGWTEGGRAPASVPGRPRKWIRPRRADDPGSDAPAARAADQQRGPRPHGNSEAPDDGCPF